MSTRTLHALGVADFRERTRRTAYLVTLSAAVALAYLALPPATSLFVILDAGGYRGLYNSAYSGTATALAGALWLMLGGFYVVRGSIARDRDTGVGQILAATPLSSVGYLLGKFWSNLLVLMSMAGVLAIAALVLQLVRQEVATVDLFALITPFLLFTLPVLALTAAAAVIVETIPVLRGGIGNIGWFFVWLFFGIGSQGLVLGDGVIGASMRKAMAAQGLPDGAEFSLGFTEVGQPLGVFAWEGLEPSSQLVIVQLAMVAVAFVMAVAPSIWFERFDPSRASTAPPRVNRSEPPPVVVAARSWRPVYRRMTGFRRRFAIGRLTAGEIRVLVQGISPWWWLVAAGVNAVVVAVPSGLMNGRDAITATLIVAWIWPVLIWSRLGTQRRENGVETLMGGYPGVHRQLLAEWVAGVVFTAAVAIGPLVRMAVTLDGAGVAAWFAGAVFIPSLALMLGALTRSHRPFQVVYTLLWYCAANQVAATDYMGVVLVDGSPVGPSPLLVAVVAGGMLLVAVGVRALRHLTR